MSRPTTHLLRLRWSFMLLVLFALAALGLAACAPQKSQPPPAPAVSPLPTQAAPTEAAFPTPTQAAARDEAPPEITRLSGEAGWDLLSVTALPDGYQYRSAYFDAARKVAYLTYTATRPLPGAADPSLTVSSTITLLQARANDETPMQAAPGAERAAALVNGSPAVYAVGAWDAEFVKDEADPNGGKMVYTWRADLPVKNIYWQIGELYLLLVTEDETVTREALVKMAESVR